MVWPFSSNAKAIVNAKQATRAKLFAEASSNLKLAPTEDQPEFLRASSEFYSMVGVLQRHTFC